MKRPEFTVSMSKNALKKILVKEFVTRGYYDYGEEVEEAAIAEDYDVRLEADKVTLFPVDRPE